MLVSIFAPLRLISGLFVALLVLGGVSVRAQSSTEQGQDDPQHEPVYVSLRVFQARVKKDEYKDLSNQVFKLPTAALTSDEKWMRAINKAYPEFKIELLRAQEARIFKSPKPAMILLGRPYRTFQFRLSAASSVGDGKTPGLTLLSEVELHYGNDKTYPPLSLAIHPIEAEEGATYFFTDNALGLDAPSYSELIRPGSTQKAFENEYFFFVFAFSASVKKPVETARVLDDKQSANLQSSATKSPQPTVPEAVLKNGLSGNVKVNVEITPDGRVARAEILDSALPEVNDEVLAVARQWEFPLSAFAENKKPIKCVLTFKLPVTSAPPKPANDSK